MSCARWHNRILVGDGESAAIHVIGSAKFCPLVARRVGITPAELPLFVVGFLVDNFLFGRTEEWRDHVSLLGNVIDSTGAIELVTFLQDRFAITVEDNEVVPENFDTLENVVAYVERKLRSKA